MQNVDKTIPNQEKISRSQYFPRMICYSITSRLTCLKFRNIFKNNKYFSRRNFWARQGSNFMWHTAAWRFLRNSTSYTENEAVENNFFPAKCVSALLFFVETLQNIGIRNKRVFRSVLRIQ